MSNDPANEPRGPEVSGAPSAPDGGHPAGGQDAPLASSSVCSDAGSSRLSSGVVSAGGLNRWNVALIALGFVPLLAVFLINLWGKPQYQFFPMAFAGAAFLAWTRRDEVGTPLRPGRPLLGFGAVGFAFFLLVLATLLWSPWFAAVGALIGAAGLLWWAGGRSMLGTMAPPLVLLLTIVPPPAHLDERFTLWLRAVATAVSTRLLDVLGVIHVRSGNVIELPQRTLLVEEACSGINSVLFTAAACLCYLFWRRRRLASFILCLPAIFAFVLLGNICRITIGALVDYRTGIDLLSGRPHEALGLVLLGCYLVAIISLDHLFLWPQAAPVAGRPAKGGAADGRGAGWVISPVWAWVAAGAFAVVGLAGVGIGIRQWQAAPFFGIAQGERFKGCEFTLPRQLAGWIQSEGGAASELETVGLYSRKWLFQNGALAASVVIDYPFAGYHDLSSCYALSGWIITGRRAEPQGAAGPPPREEIEMVRDGLDFALLAFGACDERGGWMERPGLVQRTLLDRWRGLGNIQPATFQLQLFAHGNAPLTAAEAESYRAFFAAVQGALAPQIPAQLNPKP